MKTIVKVDQEKKKNKNGEIVLEMDGKKGWGVRLRGTREKQNAETCRETAGKDE